MSMLLNLQTQLKVLIRLTIFFIRKLKPKARPIVPGENIAVFSGRWKTLSFSRIFLK